MNTRKKKQKNRCGVGALPVSPLPAAALLAGSASTRVARTSARHDEPIDHQIPGQKEAGDHAARDCASDESPRAGAGRVDDGISVRPRPPRSTARPRRTTNASNSCGSCAGRVREMKTAGCSRTLASPARARNVSSQRKKPRAPSRATCRVEIARTPMRRQAARGSTDGNSRVRGSSHGSRRGRFQR